MWRGSAAGLAVEVGSGDWPLHLRRSGCVAGYLLVVAVVCGGRDNSLAAYTANTAHRIAPMYVPTPTISLNEFTIEHVRCVIPPHRAHTTALALVSGMLPTLSGTGLGPDTITVALRWFGNHLFPVPVEETGLTATRMRRVHAARHCVEHLADTDVACVLDLAVITHTAAVTRGSMRNAAMCGSATLSVSEPAVSPRMSLWHVDYEDGQLRVPFAATAATTPRVTLDNLRLAVELTGTPYPDRVVPLSVLAAGRTGQHSNPNHATSTGFANYAEDDHDIWITHPATVGSDINRDAHIAELSGCAHYRVFEAEV